MTNDEMEAHMKASHDYPEPALWTPEQLRDIHKAEHELLELHAIEWLDGTTPHVHAA